MRYITVSYNNLGSCTYSEDPNTGCQKLETFENRIFCLLSEWTGQKAVILSKTILNLNVPSCGQLDIFLFSTIQNSDYSGDMKSVNVPIWNGKSWPS